MTDRAVSGAGVRAGILSGPIARVLAPVSVLALLLAAVVFSPSIGSGLWVRTLHNFAHGPIFGLVALTVLLGARQFRAIAALRIAHQYVIAFSAAVLLGALSELAQIPSGRDASWLDLGNDVLGAAAFLFVFAAIDPLLRPHDPTTRRFGLLFGGIAAALLLLPFVTTGLAYARRANGFPELANFTSGVGVGFISRRFAETRIVPLPAQWAGSPGEKALHIRFLPGSWPGIELNEPPPDWRGWRTLVIDVANPGPDELGFMLRIDDRQHNGLHADRYNRPFRVPAGVREKFEIPLREVEEGPEKRLLDLAAIDRVLIFRRDESQAETMYLIGVRLE